MQPASSFTFPNGSARLISGPELAANPAWPNTFADRCKDHRYYEIIEQTLGNDFEHRYLVIEDQSGQVRAIQPLFFLRQNLTEGMTGKIRDAIDFVRRRFPRFLTMRLMVGCAAGEGHLGVCAPEDQEFVARALHATLLEIARQHKASLVILKDFPAAYRKVLDHFANNGYARVPSMPYTRLALTYNDFEEYLKSLGSATRKNLRRKFRKIQTAAPITCDVVNDVTPWLDEIYPLYQAVHERSPMKFETLTKDYFREIGKRMPERARFFLWRQEGRIIAFSFCLIHGDTIYDEYLGLDYRVAYELHLYYHTIRDIISWSLQQGLKFYYSSPLNYDPKLHLGCQLAPLDLYVRHTARLLNPIFGKAVKYLEPTRHDPVLRQFSNAADLVA